MGFEDRQYYQEDERSWQIGFGGSGIGGGLGGQSAVTMIIVANVILFFLDAFTPLVGPGRHWLSEQMALDTQQPWRVWTFVTHAFAHSSIDSQLSFWHILGNMIIIFFFGRVVEARQGKIEFLKFYFLALLVGGLAVFTWHNLAGSRAICVGASGAASAVLMLFIFWYPKQTVYLMMVIPAPAWVLGVLLIAMDLSRAFDPNSHVAWQAHLGGAAFGVLYHQLKWDFRWLRWDRLPFVGSRNSVKIHRPSAKDQRLEEEADRILAKVAEEGEASLTSRERRLLNRYSKQVRKKRDS